MMFYKKLKKHVGGLISLKTQLYWYGIGLDNNPGQVCLFLDIKPHDWHIQFDASTTSCQEFWYGASVTGTTAAALLMIDGSHKWVWVDEKDIEFIDDTV